jgi:hypothetical protein
MEPKYALPQGNVKKKKHKKAIDPQKKSPLGDVIPRKGGLRGPWNPVADVRGGSPWRRPQREGVLRLELII